MLNLDLSRRTFLQLGGAACLGGGSLAAGSDAWAAPPARPDNRPLRKLADELGIQVGTCISGWLFNNEDARLLTKYRTLLVREFNLAVISWSTAWVSIEPKEGVLDYSIVDSQVLWAQKFKLALLGHTLLFPTFYEFLPEWLQKASLSKEKMTKLMRNHVTRLVKRYKGRIKSWIVVNEPHHPNFRPKDFFMEKIGPEYLEIAFETARAADPTARLIYSDTVNHTRDGFGYELAKKHLKTLKARKLVDAVAMQTHLSGKSPPAKKDLIETMKGYDTPVLVTELDIDMRGVAGGSAKRMQVQADVYRDTIEACLESGVCKTISFWETGDKWSWLVKETPGNTGVSPEAAPTLFDDDLNPKPAYKAVKDVLLARLAARPKKG